MLSAQAVVRHFYPMLKMIHATGNDNSLSIEFTYERKVHIITLTKTNRDVIPSYRRRHFRKKRPAVAIQTDECPHCHHLVVAGICTNKKCDTNNQPKPNS